MYGERPGGGGVVGAMETGHAQIVTLLTRYLRPPGSASGWLTHPHTTTDFGELDRATR